MVIDENISRAARQNTDRSRLKSAFVRALLGSLAGTGLLGIAALLYGSFGEIEARILLTTLLVGTYSILCLSSLVVVGTRHGPVGAAAIVTATAALLLGLVLTWTLDWGSDGALLEVLVKAFLICAVLAVALAHAALLLNAARGTAGPDRSVLAGTLVAITVVAALLCLAALEADPGGDGFWRVVGVFGILDVVGTVFVPITARFGSAARR